MTSSTILNLRSVLNHIEEHQLPHRHIGGGTGGPHYIDIGVDTWDDVHIWANALGGIPKTDDNGRLDLHVETLGLSWMIYSDEKRSPASEPATDAPEVAADALYGSA